MLPVLPVIFLAGGAQGARGTVTPDGSSRSQPGAGRRPYLVVAGLALSFSVFTLLGTLVLRSLPIPQDVIRWAGLVVLVLLGLGMIVPRLESLLERPFSRLPQRSVHGDRGGFLLGLALGAVYVPCAGPVLAAITVASATGRIGTHTVALTVAFALGTSAPLLMFALAGRRITERLQAFRNRQRRIRVAAGVIVIALALALTFNVSDVIQRDIPDYTSALNKAVDGTTDVAKALGSTQNASLAACAQESGSAVLENCGTAPAIGGISSWLNTPAGSAVKLNSLQGKVVLLDFWAYSCINCQRAITHDTAWYSAYHAAGLEIIGVHTPEYAFEQVAANVAAGAKRLGIRYPVALDNDYTTWNNYGNNSWPAEYLIDSTGTVRYVSIGEGDYGGTENLIRQLLSAAHPGVPLPASTQVRDTTPSNPSQTRETYLDASRADNFAGGALVAGTHTFSYPAAVDEDTFALTGTWTIGSQNLIALDGAGIRLNYDAAEIYLDVGGTGTITATVDSRSTTQTVSGAPNIYRLLDRSTTERGLLTVTVSPGLNVYSFTFG